MDRLRSWLHNGPHPELAGTQDQVDSHLAIGKAATDAVLARTPFTDENRSQSLWPKVVADLSGGD